MPKMPTGYLGTNGTSTSPSEQPGNVWQPWLPRYRRENLWFSARDPCSETLFWNEVWRHGLPRSASLQKTWCHVISFDFIFHTHHNFMMLHSFASRSNNTAQREENERIRMKCQSVNLRSCLEANRSFTILTNGISRFADKEISVNQDKHWQPRWPKFADCSKWYEHRSATKPRKSTTWCLAGTLRRPGWNDGRLYENWWVDVCLLAANVWLCMLLIVDVCCHELELTVKDNTERSVLHSWDSDFDSLEVQQGRSTMCFFMLLPHDLVTFNPAATPGSVERQPSPTALQLSPAEKVFHLARS